MAKVVADIVATTVGRREFPWDEWLDGKARELTRGEDFQGKILSFLQNGYKAAKMRGKKLRTHVVDENTVQIQAYKPE